MRTTPFRLYKSNNHEGGISTPLIAHWPKGITARGEFRHRPGHLIDIMPTVVELADLWEKEAHRTLIYPRPVGKK